MDWITQLHQLSNFPTAELLKFARRREIRFEYSRFDKKGGVQAVTNSEGKLIGLVVNINPDQSRIELEVTLIHELFHIVLGSGHPKGQYMVKFLDDLMYRFLEAKLDEASYRFREKHPEFVKKLFDTYLGKYKTPERLAART